MDKPKTPETPADAEKHAVELMEAAAYSRVGEGRLWRLEWAQAFRRLSELGKKTDDFDKKN